MWCIDTRQYCYPRLKPLVKNEDLTEALPYLFGEKFASMVKEHLETAAIHKKSVCSKQQGFYKLRLQKSA